MGDLLFGSGWPETLNEAGLVKTHAAATAFLKKSIENKICQSSYCCT